MGNSVSQIKGLVNHLAPTPDNILRYGWIPDIPDNRDMYIAHYPTDGEEDSSSSSGSADAAADILQIDLRKKFPAVYDDQGLRCSTISALAALLEYHELTNYSYSMKRLRESLGFFAPSRLFWYYVAREMQGCETSDTGVSFRNALQALMAEGVCDEHEWPYDPSQYAVAPYWHCYDSANPAVHKEFVYKRVPQTLEGIKYCLQKELPVVFGLTVYESFESFKTLSTGQIELPVCAREGGPTDRASSSSPSTVNKTDCTDPTDSVLGGHALVIVGYEDSDDGVFIVRNSQGAEWGANGYGYIPYNYVLNPTLARDFWTIERKVAQEA